MDRSYAADRGGHTAQVFGWQGVEAPRLSIAETRDLAIALEVREMSATQQRQNPADNAEPDDGVDDVVQVCGSWRMPYDTVASGASPSAIFRPPCPSCARHHFKCDHRHTFVARGLSPLLSVMPNWEGTC